jgi:hypothetical protein
MAGKQTARVNRAVKLVDLGATPYAAAKKSRIALSTIYRALKRRATSARDFSA